MVDAKILVAGSYVRFHETKNIVSQKNFEDYGHENSWGKIVVQLKFVKGTWGVDDVAWGSVG